MADMVYAADCPRDNNDAGRRHRPPRAEMDFAADFGALIVSDPASVAAWAVLRPLLWVDDFWLISAVVRGTSVAVMDDHLTVERRLLWSPAGFTIELAATTFGFACQQVVNAASMQAGLVKLADDMTAIFPRAVQNLL